MFLTLNRSNEETETNVQTIYQTTRNPASLAVLTLVDAHGRNIEIRRRIAIQFNHHQFLKTIVINFSDTDPVDSALMYDLLTGSRNLLEIPAHLRFELPHLAAFSTIDEPLLYTVVPPVVLEEQILPFQIDLV